MNNTKKVEDYLEHYGILGMRWGRRKGGESSSLFRSKSKTESDEKSNNKEHEDYTTKKKLLNKKVSELSTAELQELSRRISLEKNYKSLTAKELSPGKKFIKELLVNTAKKQITIYVDKKVSSQMEKLLGMSRSKNTEQQDPVGGQESAGNRQSIGSQNNSGNRSSNSSTGNQESSGNRSSRPFSSRTWRPRPRPNYRDMNFTDVDFTEVIDPEILRLTPRQLMLR